MKYQPSDANAMIKDRLTPITLAEAPICTRLFMEVFTGPPWNYEWVSHEKTERYMQDLLRAPGSLSFLYYDNGQPIGLCIGSINDYFFAPQYEIKEFAILAQRQQRGVGSAMLAAVEAEAARRGAAYVFLQTSKTIPAYGFYANRGYCAIEENVYLIKEL